MIASKIPDRGLFLAHLDEIGIGVEDLTPDFLLIGFELSLELLKALIHPVFPSFWPPLALTGEKSVMLVASVVRHSLTTTVRIPEDRFEIKRERSIVLHRTPV